MYFQFKWGNSIGVSIRVGEPANALIIRGGRYHSRIKCEHRENKADFY